MKQMLKKRLSYFLIFSLIIHLVLLFYVRLSDDNIKSNSVIRLTKISTPQIVSTPDQNEDQTNLEHANLLSDKDAFTKREQLKRGATEHSQPPQTTTQNTDHHHATKDSALLLNPNDYIGLLSKNKHLNSLEQEAKRAKKITADENARNATLEKAQPWTKISQSPDFFISTGSLDYLPNIPDGDITLLNTKADIFAVFVRRVALQVFATIRKNNWQQLSMREILKLNQFVTIKASMSPQGKILSATIVSSSGSATFDTLVRDAILSSAEDPHPPQEAISTIDGNIQFIFKARTWSQYSPTTFHEQRWLLLGTGLL
jgi:TonB family protein